MPNLLGTLFDLPRCPHCGVDKPHLAHLANAAPNDMHGRQHKWRIYGCSRCGGVVAATSGITSHWDQPASAWFPADRNVSTDIPERPRQFLLEAQSAIGTPSGAVMLAASSVDAMLKAKGLREGSLYARIDLARDQHLITPEMARWAHDVRLDANGERHADDEGPLPTTDRATKCVDFAFALADLLFVLPARVERGIASAQQEKKQPR